MQDFWGPAVPLTSGISPFLPVWPLWSVFLTSTHPVPTPSARPASGSGLNHDMGAGPFHRGAPLGMEGWEVLPLFLLVHGHTHPCVHASTCSHAHMHAGNTHTRVVSTHATYHPLVPPDTRGQARCSPQECPLPHPVPNHRVPTLTCREMRPSRRDSQSLGWWAGGPRAAQWQPPGCRT